MNWRNVVLSPLTILKSPILYALLTLLAGLVLIVTGVAILAGLGWAVVTAGAFAVVFGLWILIGVARSG